MSPTQIGSNQESEIDVARRHVREAEHLVARQRVLVAEMEGHGNSRAAFTGRKILQIMRDVAELAKHRLRHLARGA